MTKADPVSWLLEEGQPSIRYRTLTELLNHPTDDPEIQKARTALPKSKPVTDIFKKMHSDGYWLQKKPSTGEMIGDDIEYGAYATTHFCLAYLAELGLTREDPRIEKAANRYLDLQAPDGDFWDHFSCLNGYNLRNFILLGYGDDIRLRKTLNLMLNTDRFDGGYLCDMHEGKYKTRETVSCIRGSGKMLVAYADLPETWAHPRVQSLVNYFLRREGLFKTKELDTPAHKDLSKPASPLPGRSRFWRSSTPSARWAC